MLGTYNVNGAPCELLIDQDALVWWPRMANGGSLASDTNHTNHNTVPTTAANSNSSGNTMNSMSSPLSSPIKHLKKLSKSASYHVNAKHGADDNCYIEGPKRRRIDFDQIIGVVKVVHTKKRVRLKKRTPVVGDQDDKQQQRQTETLCDESKTATTRQQMNSDGETRNTTKNRNNNSYSPTCNLSHYDTLKVYYAKRSEKKSTGRLMKLKKITISELAQTKTRPSETMSPAAETSSSSDSSFSTPTANPINTNDMGRPLDGLCDLIEQHLELKRRQRPRRLLVFVNPFGGKGKAFHLYKTRVRRILELAQVECQLVVTKYANHARDTIEDPLFDLDQFDGIICIGGDGMFAELMNGLLFRFNRDKLLANELKLLKNLSIRRSEELIDGDSLGTAVGNTDDRRQTRAQLASEDGESHKESEIAQESEIGTGTSDAETLAKQRLEQQLNHWRSLLGGIGEQFHSPNIPIGVIGAGSTDANLFGFIGTNDTVSATLNIILGNQIQIDVSSIHSLKDDRLLRFVSTFVAYGYFGDVVRESEKLRWLGPTRYDVTALNNLIKYRNYNGLVRILRSKRDGTPLDLSRCHLNCGLCRQTRTRLSNNNVTTGNDTNRDNHSPNGAMKLDRSELVAAANCGSNDDSEKAKALDETTVSSVTTADENNDQFEIIEEEGSFVGVNAAVTACRCPQTRKGFSPGNHLANGCADLILVRSCSRVQYINYLIRTGFTSKSAFDLGYVDAYRCRQFEFVVQNKKPQPQQPDWNDANRLEGSATDDTATTDYHSKTSTKLSTNGASVESSRESSNANSLDPKQFGSCGNHHDSLESSEGVRQTTTRSTALDNTKRSVADPIGEDSASFNSYRSHNDEYSSSWNADGEILREQSIRVKVNNKLLRVFGTGEPQPKIRCRKRRTKAET